MMRYNKLFDEEWGHFDRVTKRVFDGWDSDCERRY